MFEGRSDGLPLRRSSMAFICERQGMIFSSSICSRWIPEHSLLSFQAQQSSRSGILSIGGDFRSDLVASTGRLEKDSILTAPWDDDGMMEERNLQARSGPRLSISSIRKPVWSSTSFTLVSNQERMERMLSSPTWTEWSIDSANKSRVER